MAFTMPFVKKKSKPYGWPMVNTVIPFETSEDDPQVMGFKTLLGAQTLRTAMSFSTSAPHKFAWYSFYSSPPTLMVTVAISAFAITW